MVEIKDVPKPTIERICKIYQVLGDLEKEKAETVTSSRLADLIGFSSHSIRKDLSLIGFTGNNGARYQVKKLKELIGNVLCFDRQRKICVVGLGRIGSAILNYPNLKESGFEIAAGFDSSVNKLETLKTDVKLFPAYQIPEIVKRDGIDTAVLAVPSEAAQSSAERLAEGGIKGILNFTPANIRLNAKEIFVANIDLVNELRVVSVMSDLSFRSGSK
ncbi:MAG TPA: redox-sensing transcriptional repressor Rex [Spirochaetota bacterium]|jgi:redox-sensing transcriptional repressor|nr:redox-sensing transcriptional repressor Rex [Spirochaetota bacterium]HPJ16046.1 redox-sensing transcriptional repressor Rex [Spirochaetota bacterium]HPK57100.1 redox-sensing transcriptional repressor Rex [Spirochaetota bacterium]HQO22591.1 redox-sensing transcriptional repressor Rex [Spirochaetota bacterium]